MWVPKRYFLYFFYYNNDFVFCLNYSCLRFIKVFLMENRTQQMVAFVRPAGASTCILIKSPVRPRSYRHASFKITPIRQSKIERFIRKYVRNFFQNRSIGCLKRLAISQRKKSAALFGFHSNYNRQDKQTAPFVYVSY